MWIDAIKRFLNNNYGIITIIIVMIFGFWMGYTLSAKYLIPKEMTPKDEAQYQKVISSIQKDDIPDNTVICISKNGYENSIIIAKNDGKLDISKTARSKVFGIITNIVAGLTTAILLVVAVYFLVKGAMWLFAILIIRTVQ